MTPAAITRANLDAIANGYGLTLDALKEHRGPRSEGERRRVEARRACYLYLREKGWSFPRIAALFDRDHSAVIYAIRPKRSAARKREDALLAQIEGRAA